MWIAVDDTDGPDGGCTTYTLTEVITAAQEYGLDLIGEPRLVRLDPNVPTKTRGNAALAARFGHGAGTRRRQGVLPTGTLWSFARGTPPRRAEQAGLVERAWSAVRRTSTIGTPGTDPVLVALAHRPASPLYWEAVSRWVAPESVEPILAGLGAEVRSESDRGGIVGAAAALAWPSRSVTWELIAYRPPARWGRRREVDAESVRGAQRDHASLFLCHDPRTRRLLVAPHTSCPILFGLRSRDRASLAAAAREVRSEPVERWIIFRTNQGTGDHLQPRSVLSLRPYDAGRVRGVVRGDPIRLPGGHVQLDVTGSDGGLLRCLVFEPTKTLPAIVAQLVDGDRVEVWGGRGDDPTFRVEGIRVFSRPAGVGPRRGPWCEVCSRRSHSIGRARGYRCPGCHSRFPLELAERTPGLAPPLGTHHPTASARRHLAPLGPELYAMT
ncbi:MAG: DUF1743 domain-containing protein [Thermoplasmata archaeon]|nr:DUF1743 domain-containing protein [Thermoplasmata archaeon]